jgi:hypothetical protein
VRDFGARVVQPLIRRGLRPRHLLPQGERGFSLSVIFLVFFQCLTASSDLRIIADNT